METEPYYDEISKEWSDNYYLVCPYCLYKDQDAWEHNLDKPINKVSCNSCGKDFKAWEITEITYYSQKVED